MGGWLSSSSSGVSPKTLGDPGTGEGIGACVNVFTREIIKCGLDTTVSVFSKAATDVFQPTRTKIAGTGCLSGGIVYQSEVVDPVGIEISSVSSDTKPYEDHVFEDVDDQVAWTNYMTGRSTMFPYVRVLWDVWQCPRRGSDGRAWTMLGHRSGHVSQRVIYESKCFRGSPTLGKFDPNIVNYKIVEDTAEYPLESDAESTSVPVSSAETFVETYGTHFVCKEVYGYSAFYEKSPSGEEVLHSAYGISRRDMPYDWTDTIDRMVKPHISFSESVATTRFTPGCIWVYLLPTYILVQDSETRKEIRRYCVKRMKRRYW
jgi:hypothetical protein